MEKHNPTPVVNITCNEECLWTLGKSVYEDPIHQCGRMPNFALPVMYMMACQRLLSDLDTTKYIRLFEGPANDPHTGKEHHLSKFIGSSG